MNIKRYKNIVGKFIGGKIYVHKEYSGLVVPFQYLLLLKSDIYNVVVFDTKKGLIKSVFSKEFDTESEPKVGLVTTYDTRTSQCVAKREYNQVWHHKWLWVMDDYKGFDVKKEKKWSIYWSNLLLETANGSSLENWQNQLKRFNITREQFETT